MGWSVTGGEASRKRRALRWTRCRRGPHLHCVVPTAADNPRSVGAAGHAGDRTRMPRQSECCLPRHRVPHLQRLVINTTDNPLPVRAVRHTSDRTLMSRLRPRRWRRTTAGRERAASVSSKSPSGTGESGCVSRWGRTASGGGAMPPARQPAGRGIVSLRGGCRKAGLAWDGGPPSAHRRNRLEGRPAHRQRPATIRHRSSRESVDGRGGRSPGRSVHGIGGGCTGLAVVASHTFSVLSSLPLTIRFPSGL